MDLKILLIVLVTCKGASSFLFTCAVMVQANCYDYRIDHICATDGVTYRNWCAFKKHKCQQHPNLEIAYYGTCSATSTHLPTTLSTTTTSLPPDVCDVVHDVTCDNTLEPICGTDNQWYLNMCEFDKARCETPTISVAHTGFC